MKNNKGFSLVELIVVIAIMAILAAVAVVSYSVYIERAQNAADEEYLSNVVYRAELFALENQIPLVEVVVAPEVDGPEDIKLVIGYTKAGDPIYYDGDTREIFEAVGNAKVEGGLNNGKFDPNLPEDEVPDNNDGEEVHQHEISTERKEPTCRADGYEKESCECGYVKITKLPAVAHNYEKRAEQGSFAYYVCDMCGHIIIKSTDGSAIVPIG